jgi:hypothetical protein
VLNPLLAWASNRELAFVPLLGSRSIVVDTAVTSVVLSVLVAVCVTPGARRAFKAGRLVASGEPARRAGLRSRLPYQAWRLGTVLGFAVVLLVIPLLVGAAVLLGIPGLSFPWFAAFKAMYTALLAFAVTRWVILRQSLSPANG